MTTEPTRTGAARGDNSTLIALLLAIVAVMLWAMRDVLMLVGFSALLAYALDPIVGTVERIRLPRIGPVPRAFAAAIVMLALVSLVGWAVAVNAARFLAELGRIAETIPEGLDRLSAWVDTYVRVHGLGETFGTSANRPVDIAALLRADAGAIAGAVGRLFGNLGGLLGILLVPVLAFYLLAEREAVWNSALDFLPEHVRPRVLAMSGAVDQALRSYVRGQSVVCLVMGVSMIAALSLAQHPLALVLGVGAGIAEVIPFLGFWIMIVAIALTGFGVSPMQALIGVIVYIVVNQLLGMLITPRVMARHMKMHPFVVTVSVLAGGALLGAGGAVLALPAAAAIQSVMSTLTVARARRKTGVAAKSS